MSGRSFPVSIYLIKVSNENTKTGCETIKNSITITMSFWYFFCYLWTIFTQCFNIFIAEFELEDENQFSYLPLHYFAYNLSFSPNIHIQNWCFNFRTSLTEEFSDAVAYSDYKSCEKEARTVKNPNRQDWLIPFFKNQ